MLLKYFVNPKAKPIIPEIEITIKILFKKEATLLVVKRKKKGDFVYCVVIALLSHVFEFNYECNDTNSDEYEREIIPNRNYCQ